MSMMECCKEVVHAWDMHAFNVVGIYRKQFPESTASTFDVCSFKKTGEGGTGEGGVRKI